MTSGTDVSLSFGCLLKQGFISFIQIKENEVLFDNVKDVIGKVLWPLPAQDPGPTGRGCHRGKREIIKSGYQKKWI
jgi:hypothetical protein